MYDGATVLRRAVKKLIVMIITYSTEIGGVNDNHNNQVAYRTAQNSRAIVRCNMPFTAGKREVVNVYFRAT